MLGWFLLLEDIYCLAAFLQFPAPLAFYYSLAPLEAEAVKDVEQNVVLMWKTVLRERFENHDLFIEGLPGRLGRLENTWGRVGGNSSKET